MASHEEARGLTHDRLTLPRVCVLDTAGMSLRVSE